MLVAPQVKIKASPPARITGGRELGTLDKRAKADIKGDGRRNMIGIPDIGLVAFTNLGAAPVHLSVSSVLSHMDTFAPRHHGPITISSESQSGRTSSEARVV